MIVPTTAAGPRLDAEQGRVADGCIRLVGQPEGHEDADNESEQQPDEERPADPPGAYADRGEPAGNGDRYEQEDAVQDAPADRSQEPLPEEQRRPDDGEDDREDDDRDRDADIGGDLWTSPAIAAASAFARSMWACARR